MNNSFVIRPLSPQDAAAVSGFLESQPREDSRFFYAFGADRSSIFEMLAEASSDVYAGVFWRSDLIGIFMLRGWDAGYETPSYGVFIDSRHRSWPLFRLTLNSGKLICRLAGVKSMMAKVHPENLSPKGMIRLGFRQTGIEESTGNIIYHMDL
jgi:hypothetical protein